MGRSILPRHKCRFGVVVVSRHPQPKSKSSQYEWLTVLRCFHGHLRTLIQYLASETNSGTPSCDSRVGQVRAGQWPLGLAILTSSTGNKRSIKEAFKILILATQGAVRAIGLGVKEGASRCRGRASTTLCLFLLKATVFFKPIVATPEGYE